MKHGALPGKLFLVCKASLQTVHSKLEICSHGEISFQLGSWEPTSTLEGSICKFADVGLYLFLRPAQIQLLFLFFLCFAQCVKDEALLHITAAHPSWTDQKYAVAQSLPGRSEASRTSNGTKST